MYFDTILGVMAKNEISIGETVADGKYRIEELIASGGMGVIYKATHVEIGHLVAIKYLHRKHIDNPRAIKRFQQEARLAGSIGHDNICEVTDIGVDEYNSPYLVMPFLKGSSFDKLILRSDELYLDRVIDILSQTLSALGAAHRNYIVHRDLKPSNIFVSQIGDREDFVRLLDFGVSKVLDPKRVMELTQTGMALGTPYYMSPEQARGKKDIDYRVDIYATGVILFEALTGVRPFGGESYNEVMFSIVSEQFQLPTVLNPSIPHELETVIVRAMARNREDRYSTAEEMQRELEECPREYCASEHRSIMDSADTVPRLSPPFSTSKLEEETKDRLNTETTSKSNKIKWWYYAIAISLIAVFVTVFFFTKRNNSSLEKAPEIEALANPADKKKAEELTREGQELLVTFVQKNNRKEILESALDAFKQALTIDSDSALANAELSRAYYQKYLGNPDKVWIQQTLGTAKRAVELDPNLATARVSLGNAYILQDKPAKALNEFNQALALDPMSAIANEGIAKVWIDRSDLVKAVQYLKKAIQLSPNNREFLDRLGRLYYLMGKGEKAIETYLKSTEMMSNGITAHYSLGAIYLERGNFDKATQHLKRAIEIEPNEAVYSNLGTLYFTQGKFIEATSMFEKAVSSPGGSNFYLNWGNLGDGYRWTPGKEENAKEAYQAGLELLREQMNQDPDNPEHRVFAAMYMAKKGDVSGAVKMLTTIDKKQNLSPDLWYSLTIIYDVLGEKQLALDALSNAVTKGYPLIHARRDPELVELRQEPEFHTLMVKLGHSHKQTAVDSSN